MKLQFFKPSRQRYTYRDNKKSETVPKRILYNIHESGLLQPPYVEMGVKGIFFVRLWDSLPNNTTPDGVMSTKEV